ncbi:Elf1-domain-containing protein, partial [Peniophora sp. CONT]
MGKRKKSSRKPAQPRLKPTLDTQFTCIFCHHDNAVQVKIDKKEGIAQLTCRVCDQRYQSKVHHLTEAVDIYAEWQDAADEAEKNARYEQRPAQASSSRPRPAP